MAKSVLLAASLISAANAGWVKQTGWFLLHKPNETYNADGRWPNAWGAYTASSYNPLYPSSNSYFLNDDTHSCYIPESIDKSNSVTWVYTDNLETSMVNFDRTNIVQYPDWQDPQKTKSPEYLECVTPMYDDLRRGLAHSLEIWVNVNQTVKYPRPTLWSVGGLSKAPESLALHKNKNTGNFDLTFYQKSGVADMVASSTVKFDHFHGQIVVSFNYDHTISVWFNGKLGMRSKWQVDFLLRKNLIDVQVFGSDGFEGELISFGTYWGEPNEADILHKIDYGPFFPGQGYFDNSPSNVKWDDQFYDPETDKHSSGWDV